VTFIHDIVASVNALMHSVSAVLNSGFCSLLGDKKKKEFEIPLQQNTCQQHPDSIHFSESGV